MNTETVAEIKRRRALGESWAAIGRDLDMSYFQLRTAAEPVYARQRRDSKNMQRRMASLARTEEADGEDRDTYRAAPITLPRLSCLERPLPSEVDLRLHREAFHEHA